MKTIHIQKKVHRLKFKRLILRLLIFVPLGIGVYLLLLLYAPNVNYNKSNYEIQRIVDLNNSPDLDESLPDENQLLIPALNLQVPILEGDESSLDKGAWHRLPERGDPENDGNFIVTAHRFSIQLTPGRTAQKSPFYNLNLLKKDDEIYVVWNKKKYTYKVTETFEVDPYAVEIEEKTNLPVLTLYSCTLKGRYDGRLVVRAVPA